VQNEEIKHKLQKGSAPFILDVREEVEYMLGHIPGAISVPLSEFERHLVELQREQTYYVICRTGNRSNAACLYMQVKGFTDVYNVIPGMSEWDGDIEE
jgi:rhodanese-related sulfurtransferase